MHPRKGPATFHRMGAWRSVRDGLLLLPLLPLHWLPAVSSLRIQLELGRFIDKPSPYH